MERNSFKRILFLLIIALSSMLLVACGNDLSTPSITVNSDNSISWSSIEKANGYVVSINGENHETPLTKYEISTIGDFKVKVKATNDKKESSWSNEVNVTISKQDSISAVNQLESPKNIRLSNNKVTWDEVTGASSYIVYVNGIKQTTDKTEININNQDNVVVKVIAVSDYEDILNSISSYYSYHIKESLSHEDYDRICKLHGLGEEYKNLAIANNLTEADIEFIVKLSLTHFNIGLFLSIDEDVNITNVLGFLYDYINVTKDTLEIENDIINILNQLNLTKDEFIEVGTNLIYDANEIKEFVLALFGDITSYFDIAFLGIYNPELLENVKEILDKRLIEFKGLISMVDKYQPYLDRLTEGSNINLEIEKIKDTLYLFVDYAMNLESEDYQYIISKLLFLSETNQTKVALYILLDFCEYVKEFNDFGEDEITFDLVLETISTIIANLELDSQTKESIKSLIENVKALIIEYQIDIEAFLANKKEAVEKLYAIIESFKENGLPLIDDDTKNMLLDLDYAHLSSILTNPKVKDIIINILSNQGIDIDSKYNSYVSMIASETNEDYKLMVNVLCCSYNSIVENKLYLAKDKYEAYYKLAIVIRDTSRVLNSNDFAKLISSELVKDILVTYGNVESSKIDALVSDGQKYYLELISKANQVCGVNGYQSDFQKQTIDSFIEYLNSIK